MAFVSPIVDLSLLIEWKTLGSSKNPLNSKR
jgi:hypothetical protein